MTLQVLLPELGQNQLTMLQRLLQEVLGDPIDTQNLVRQGKRSEAKDGFAVNHNLTQQQKRFNKLFGIEEPKGKDNRWHLK